MAASDPTEAESLLPDLERDLAALQADWGRMEQQLLLSEPFDERGAIVSVHAGAGGTESQDWAEMLLRMYLRWGERNRFRTEILEATEGEEAGLKSVSFSVDGRWAYGRLRSERGVHRLVRISPYDSQKRRHTSFALVEVMPEVPEDAAIEIDEKDLRVDTYRSSGAGGQHVNKTDSAVRLTHLPTGIVVAVQSERSQHQNRDRAMSVLRAKLVERQEEEREAELARLRGEHVEAGWGNQIRSYVLQPYTMVKDLRTASRPRTRRRCSTATSTRSSRATCAGASARATERRRPPRTGRAQAPRRRGRCAPAGPRSATRKTAEPANANQNGAVMPNRWASSPPSAEPTTRPPKTPTVLTLPTRPWSSVGTARWRTVTEVVPHRRRVRRRRRRSPWPRPGSW